MSPLEAVAASGVANALSAAILHSLWQGTFLGLAAAAVLKMMGGRSAQVRYLVAFASLVLLFALFVGTFAVALERPEPGSRMTALVRGEIPLPGAAAGPSTLERSIVSNRIAGSFPAAEVVALAWLVGAAAVAARTGFQFSRVRRLRASADFEIDDRWRVVFAGLVREIGLQRIVRLARSHLVDVPTVVGWLSPMVLVPASAWTALTPEQLRAVLAHELAHIKRCDYLLNAIQKAIESVLFFHPATWWLGHRIRVEREYCCDDEAVRITGNALVYARALSQLEALRAERPQLALAANGGSLVNRITRIVGTKSHGFRLRTLTAASAAAVLAVVALGAGYAGLRGANAEEASTKEAVTTSAAKPEYTLEQVIAEVKARVAAGEITDEQGWNKITAFKLGAMVKSGELTVEQAKAKFAWYVSNDKTAKKPEMSRDDLVAMIEASVAAGKITPEQAAAKLAKMK